MKKIILSIAMLATVTFTGCSDDESDDNCRSCDNLANSGINVEVCDNGDGTATATATTSIGNVVLATRTEAIPEGEDFDDVDCSDFDEITIDLDALDQ